MTAKKPKSAETVWCRRLERRLPVLEHSVCPYCFGDASKIERADHRQFCDFQPGEDPVSFGFPPDEPRRLAK